MNAQNRRMLLLGLFAVAMFIMLLAATAWSVRWMMLQRAEAQHAADVLANCEFYAKAIADGDARQTVAGSEDQGVQFLGERIDAAAQVAAIGRQKQLQGIVPQSPRPVRGKPYLLKPTILTLRGVNLAQLATFLHHLENDGPGVTVEHIRLRTPHGQDEGDLWNAEATVTYLVYMPDEEGGSRE